MESDPARAYEQRKAELEARNQELDARERSLSALRGVTFLAAGGLGLFGGIRESVPLGIGAAIAFVAFAVAVVAHAILITKKAEIELRLSLVARGLSRVADAFESLPERGERFAPEQHPYAKDLDLFGQRSLFQLLVTAETAAGQRSLASWLLTGASAKTVAERQEAARELATRPDLREDLAVLARQARAKMPPDVLFAWGEAKGAFESEGASRLAISARFLAPITVTLAILGWTLGPAMGLARHAWLVTMAIQLVAVLKTGVATERSLAAAASREEPLGRFSPVFRRIEETTFESALLTRCHAALLGDVTADPAKTSEGAAHPPSSASAAMSRLQTILSFADLRHAGIFHLLIHLFTLWDLWCAVALEAWRAKHGRRIRQWIEALATLEALASLATFAFEHPAYVFPEVTEGPPRYAADALGHPLLPAARRVVNSVAFAKRDGSRGAAASPEKASKQAGAASSVAPQALLITGSNMSGKSTMLRSIGTNAVLALAGAPVCAARLAMTTLDVRTSMRITDSLEQGVSHFYAELSRLKEITAASDAGSPVLFLLDEVLHGTNSRERQIGAKAVVKHLLRAGAIGAVSSHDLGLATLEEETAGDVTNAHFEEHVEGETMAFDYLLKPGVVTTTNALRLMRVVGLPIGDAE
ncbi:MAG: DNA mismatch repair protein MutS [Polyangiaceae bacterium]